MDHPVHSHAASASLLVMVRRTLVRQSQLAYHDIIPGRLMHIRLMLTQIFDLYAVYLTAWNTSKTHRGLLLARQDLWDKFRRGIQNIPKGHQLILAGDFNTPLNKDPSHVGSINPRFNQALQADKHQFQQLIQDLSLTAVHCHQKYVPTFLHGTHRSRIDFVFLRNFQVRWRHLRAQVDHKFEWIGIYQGPQHRPLLIHLPRWHAIRKPPTQIPAINRFRLRQEMKRLHPDGKDLNKLFRVASSDTGPDTHQIQSATAYTWKFRSVSCVLNISHLSKPVHTNLTSFVP